MEDISLHILDVVENSIAAGATKIEITIVEDLEQDLLVVEIVDDGRGMDEETLAKVVDPFYTTRTTRRVGLGIPFLQQSARESGGDLEIWSQVGVGTRIRATFRHSHIDRKPMGDLAATLETLILGNPTVRFVFEHRSGDETCRLDTGDLG